MFIVKLNKRYFFIPIFLFITISGYGQEQKLIQGMVVDSATFQSMEHVNIAIKNQFKGTQSNSDGTFKLFATSRDTLVFSFVGYKTIEISIYNWQEGIILMAEDPYILNSITVQGKRLKNSFYEEIFEDKIISREKEYDKLPFYYSKEKKERIKVQRFENENARVQTYMDVVVFNVDLKKNLMKKYDLKDSEYYDLLSRFNEQHHKVMYYLTASELLSLLYRFYEVNAN